MLGRHGLVVVEGGGVEGHLGHLGDAADGVGLARACALVLVLPVAEELLEQGGLAPCWQHLDLQEEDGEGEVSLQGRRPLGAGVRSVRGHGSEVRVYLGLFGVALVLDKLLSSRHGRFAFRHVGFGPWEKNTHTHTDDGEVAMLVVQFGLKDGGWDNKTDRFKESGKRRKLGPRWGGGRSRWGGSRRVTFPDEHVGVDSVVQDVALLWGQHGLLEGAGLGHQG